MCEPTPDPPADVDFSRVQDSTKGTVRGRLLDHMNNTGCAACHRRTDPPGLALEHFDGLGQMRTMENGARIDVRPISTERSSKVRKVSARFLHEDPKVPACLVRNVYAYGVGRKTDERDEDYLADQAKAFAGNGYRVPDLMVQIASSAGVLQSRRSSQCPACDSGPVGRDVDAPEYQRSRSMSFAFNRRSFLRGMLGGTAVYVGLPILDGSSTAMARHSPMERSCRSGSAHISGGWV